MKLLTPEELRLLELLAEEEALDLPVKERIPKRALPGSAPLSFAQERLWFLSKLDPESTAYHLPFAARIDGHLDAAGLERGLQALVARHEALRTTFSETEGKPVQIIHETLDIHLARIDLRTLGEAVKDSETRRLIREEAHELFSLEKGPLLRCRLLVLDEDAFILLLTMHHIVSDGWSMLVLMRELIQGYGDFAAGSKVSSLPDLAVQYGDFAAWQRQWLQGERLASQLEFWKHGLAGAPPISTFPSDWPRPTKQRARGAQLPFALTAPLVERLRNLASEEDASLFMTLLAAISLLVSRYTHQDDILIGSPIANRDRSDLEGLIGLFANTLVFRTNLTGNPTFRDLLARVRQTTLANYEHQQLPFEQLVHALNITRSLSHTPMFQVMLILQNMAPSRFEIEGLTLEPLTTETGMSKFDLTLELKEEDGGLTGFLEYNTDLYDRSTLVRLRTHFQNLLVSIADTPDERVSRVHFLESDERRRLVQAWNQTGRNYPEELSLAHLFEAQVRSNPGARALILGERQLTFAELNARANQVARVLRDRGVGPGRRVGVLCYRSPEMVIGMLATLKAGGAYLALDPSFPDERLAFLVEDANLAVVITLAELAGKISTDGSTLLELDQNSAEIDSRATANLDGDHHPELPAYLIYTSGSTGKPRGVVAPHRAVLNRLHWMWEAFPFDAGEICCQKTSLNFVDSVWEIWGPLLQGVPLVLVPEKTLLDPSSLVDLMKRCDVTRIGLVPTHLQLLLEGENPAAAALSGIKIWVTSGEPLPRALARRFIEVLPQAKLLNLYGSSEVSADVSWREIEAEDTRWTGVAPIGRPIDNVKLYILDGELQPLPVGVVGELYVAGANLATGYLDQPVQTAARFLPDPFATAQPGRLFKTGDLARFRVDGDIEFEGRIDDQVKIRGFRVEPGEIAQVLLGHTGIKEAAVVLRGQAYKAFLVAFFVADGERVPTVPELKAHLQEFLPAYMIPAVFHQMAALPLTSSGKINRRALPEVGPGTEGSKAEYASASTANQQILVEIWVEVLGHQTIGIHDDFFDLGGHSLLAVQVISRIQKVLGLEMRVGLLFKHPTIAALAEVLDDLTGPADQQLEIAPIPRDQPPPLSFAQQRLWFLEQLDSGTASGSAAYNLPYGALLEGPLEAAILGQALQALTQRHESLRTHFPEVDGDPIQVVDPLLKVDLEIVDLRTLETGERDAAVEKLADRESRLPFNLAEGPLVRYTLLALEPQRHILLLTMHHIISDGWSMGVFVSELVRCYRDLRAGKEVPDLAELRIQYPDFAFWQRQWLRGDLLDKQLAYWKAELDRAPVLLEFPSDRPRPRAQTFVGGEVALRLTPELTTRLKALARAEGVSLFMILLAGFKLLLYRYSGQPDILVGTPFANRNRPEIEGLIGFFVNTLVVRTRFEHDASFRTLLGQVREKALQALHHGDIPFELLVKEMGVKRALSHTPLFQVMFIFQNMPPADLSLPDLSLKPFRRATGAAKFDLTLELQEHQEELVGSMEYSADLFDRETITRLASHLEVLLGQIAADPDGRLQSFGLLSADERDAVLYTWNHTERAYRVNEGIHGLFEARANRAPDDPALIFKGQRLTFGEVNRAANQLAGYLIRQGVEPGQIVGVFSERRPEMVISFLAILKVGAAYMALDPAYPPARLGYMLEDAGVTMLVQAEANSEAIPGYQGDVIDLSRDGEAIGRESIGEGNFHGAPDGLAYVIYTSGSTGQPKGVMTRHGAALNRFNWMWERFPFRDGEVCCQKTALNFVDSVWETWGPLLQGVPLVLVPEEIVVEPESFIALLAEQRVSRLVLVPSLLRLLLDSPAEQLGKIAGLELWITSGELLPNELADRFHEQLPGSRLLNLYGSSEVSADVTFAELNRVPSHSAAVPIGRPIANTRIYLLDQALQLVPPGALGEIYVAGANLACGYLGRGAQTAERFIPDPFAQLPGERLYKTGDLARQRPDGQCEFSGRRDHQVKVRGFRVELGEIGTRLAAHPDIRQALVTLGGDRTDPQLAAYIVAEPGRNVPIPEIKQFLRRSLPDYMIPTLFMELDGLPLTPNGKIDRQALPALEAQLTPRVSAPPTTAFERVLVEIWTQVLGLEEIGINENFFDLGGHSLRAVQVVTRIGRTLGYKIPVRRLFEAPTIAELAELLEQATENAVPQASLAPAPANVALPLSFEQQRLWFLDQLEGDSGVYHLPFAAWIHGNLDTAAFERALSQLIARQASLRTTFEAGESGPVQRIAEPEFFPLEPVDLSALTAPEQERALAEEMARIAALPFDLSLGPLLRCRLFRLAPQRHLFFYDMHHIISDGWSRGVFVGELIQLYRGEPLAELPLRYADFAYRQREWLQTEQLAPRLAYWKAQLAGSPALLRLPTDRPRPREQRYLGQDWLFTLPGPLTQRLRILAREEGATLFIPLLAAFTLLLSRYSGQDDVLVGTPVANRERPEIEGLIGFFVNNLVLRTRLDHESCFRGLIRDVRETTLEAFGHREVPFEYLVQEMAVARDLSHAPLFQVMFILQNTPPVSTTMVDLKLESYTLPKRVSKFDLTLEFTEVGEGLEGVFEFSSDLFDEASIARMQAHFSRLLEAVAADPDRMLHEIDMLGEEESERLLGAWNQTAADFSFERPIHSLFEEQAARHPERFALFDGELDLTFAELNERANQMARFLGNLGAGPASFTGVYLPRGADMIVCLLAILKTGGAYLALDPTYPKQRSAFMLRDAGVGLLISCLALRDELPDYHGRILCLEAEKGLIEEQEVEDLALPVATSRPAYLIYTSGSTGNPKGVLADHRAALNRFQWMWSAYPFVEDDVCCLRTSLNFVDSVWEIWGPLLRGVPLAIIPEEVVVDAAIFAKLIEKRRITRLVVVPSLLRVLLAGGKATIRRLSGIRIWVSSGESLPLELVAAFQTQLPHAVLLNLYGSSEVSADVTCREFSGAPLPDGFSAPIGKPIANCRTYILDAYGRPTPQGLVGELFVGGNNLAIGYLNRPARTAESFLPDPFANRPGSRLYRTGDLARYRGEGDIEIMGRADHQVKIRGFRVEPAEIEHHLRRYRGVSQAAVVVRGSGDHRALVAYFVASDPTLQAEGLSVHLAEFLPYFMIPAHFVALDELPLTPNGKLDRAALPEICLAGAGEQASFDPPKSAVEQVLAGVWTEILKLNTIGRNDNFFSLGGHSLLATQVVTRMRDTLGVDIPVRALFESPTIATLAQKIETLDKNADIGRALLLLPVDRDKPLPLSFGQQRQWFLYQMDPSSSAYHIHFALEVAGPLRVDLVLRCLSTLIRRHESLRTRFHETGEGVVQVLAPESRVAFDQLDLEYLSDNERNQRLKALVEAEVTQPFDLSRGPLLRTTLARLGQDRHAILLTMHHIISDGWSMGLLVGEFIQLYKAFALDQADPLPSLTFQYADFAVRQQQWLRGEVRERLVRYWRNQLASTPALLELPTDRPRPAVQTFRGATLPFRLSQDLSDQLRALCREEGVSLFMGLLTAFNILLARYTNRVDIVVGSPIANRNHAMLERLIGLFVNTLALRSDLSGNPSFREALGRVREVTLDAYAHQDLPFEHLVQELGVERDLSTTPVFQVMLVLQNAPVTFESLPELTFTRLERTQISSKFDLSLELAEEESGLVGFFEFNTDLFDEDSVQRLGGHLKTILTKMVNESDTRSFSFPLVTGLEREQILITWNGSHAPLGGNLTVRDMFEARVVEMPDAVALVFEDVSLSYAELNGRANQLAHELIRLGAGPERPIGICSERSPEMIIGMLGIMKSGAPYVAMDPGYPPARLSYMLGDACIGILVTTAETGLALLDDGVHRIELDRAWAAIADNPNHNPPARVHSKNLAYVNYTSGSTGQPKGVQIPHEALTNLLQSIQACPGFTREDVLFSVTSMAFDIFGIDLFLPLTTGGKLVLASRHTVIDDARLRARLESSGATLMQATPATWSMLLEEGWPGDPGLTIFCTGDALPLDLARRLVTMGRSFWNLYGPTETTVWSIIHQVSVDDTKVLIGKPIANTSIYLLDSELNPVPIGVPGALYIGGLGLARGYWNRPAISADRFRPNPFATSPGEVLYNTGDLARYDGTGTIEFLGRMDHQIKLRGFRIELGEIETVLNHHESVNRGVVMAVSNATGETQIHAYVLPNNQESCNLADLRRYLADRLPTYMIPSHWEMLDELPLTPNRKVDRAALSRMDHRTNEGNGAAPDNRQGGAAKGAMPPLGETEQKIAQAWAEVLQRSDFSKTDNFFEVGGHSLSILKVRRILEQALERKIEVTTLFQYPSIGALAQYLTRGHGETRRLPLRTQEDKAGVAGEGIAVIGMAGRFPGANNVAAFWRNLHMGVESVMPLSDETLLAEGVAPELLTRPDYVKANPLLDRIEYFDAAFFGYTPREAELMDPQHRLFLEECWKALESAGYDPLAVPGKVAVFAGAGVNGYFINHLVPNPQIANTVSGRQLMTIDKDYLATRVSYKFNLTGPSFSVQTACSTSLVAIHLACEQLLFGKADMALAGGVTVNVSQKQGYFQEKGGYHSPDGHCRPFDHKADGTLFGSAVAVVVLKPLARALADGDQILAVIKGSAINNDGSDKVGFAAPSVTGQSKVILEALQDSKVNPESIGFVEAHGTGTHLGDPVEVAALTQAYRQWTERRNFCALGSVKSNMGHLDAAAGVTGFIKATLALRYGLIPPTLHFQKPNPELSLEESPFFVNNESMAWPRRAGQPRTAAVSSLGIGGTNAHVILEEAPLPSRASESIESSKPWRLLAWSAKTRSALKALMHELTTFLQENPDVNFEDAAYTLNTGRHPHEVHQLLVCKNREDALGVLTAEFSERLMTGKFVAKDAGVVLMFPGQATQYLEMGWDIYQNEAVFREAVDHCSELLHPMLGFDQRECLYPAFKDPARVLTEPEREEASERMMDIVTSQALLFTINYATASLWRSWGVRPRAMIGFSSGEYVAATLAGVFTLNDALSIVIERARLIEQLPPGAMLAVRLTEEQAQAHTGDLVSLGIVSGPDSCVLSGDRAKLQEISDDLTAQEIDNRFLRMNQAGHSFMFDPILPAFEAFLQDVTFKPPQIPFVSCVTGNWVDEAEVTSPAYWVRHLRQTVRFADAMAVLLRDSGPLFLEVGAGRSLSSMVGQQPLSSQDTRAFSSLRHPKDEFSDYEILLTTLGRLHLSGAKVDWQAFYSRENRRRIPLPTYPFQSKRYWIEAPQRNRFKPAEAVETEAAVTGYDRPELTADFQAPRNGLERTIADIWGQMLGFKEVGIEDNFFELGGDSLAATNFISRWRRNYAYELSLRDFFKTPTVAGLAWGIRQNLEREGNSDHPLTKILHSPADTAAASTRAVSPTRVDRILPASRPGDLPLSFSQQRLWFFYRFDPESRLYNIPFAAKIEGDLEPAALARALEAVTMRHEALRTTFGERAGLPFQRISEHAAAALATIDLRGLSEPERKACIHRIMREEPRVRFDLSAGPLFRCRLLMLAPRENLLMLTMHHIIADGWSFNIFIREMVAVYQDFAAGKAAHSLPQLPIQYPDFAIWQRSRLEGGMLGEQLAYWKEKLVRMPSAMDLPIDFPRPAQQRYDGDYLPFSLSVELTQQLKAFAKREGTTLFTVVLACFQVLLSRYVEREDLVVGSPIANRNRDETAGLIGFFVNMLVMRTDLTGNPDFREILGRVREVTIEAYQNQDVPFELLIQELGVARDLSRAPLFQVMLNIPEEFEKADMPGQLSLTPLSFEGYVSKYDLSLELLQSRERLAGFFEYSTALFKRTTIARMAEHFRLLIERLIANPDLRLNEVSLLTEAETAKILGHWKGAPPETLPGDSIQQLFTARAAMHPEKVALICEDRHMTFGELDSLANRLAHHLSRNGANPESVVGVCLERSPKLIAALLGTLKAGCAYLFLDPGYPLARLDHMLGDAEVAAVITVEALLEKLPETDRPLICLDRDAAALTAVPNRDPVISTSHLAYVIYTSGSTGRPKGIAASQIATLNRLHWMWQTYPFRDDEVCCQKTSLNFVDSVWEIWGPLLKGIPICLIADEDILHPPRFATRLTEHRVTRLVLVPSLLRVLLESDPETRAALSGLRLWITSGEPFSAHLLLRFRENWPQAQLLNLYGSSEVAADVTCHDFSDQENAEITPIGHPLTGVRLYLLNRKGHLVPPGLPGEIHIGGRQVALGYLNLADQTAARFLPDPFSEDAGARLFKTGDVARFSDDGSLLFESRRDDQVKVRGFRVELGEVERALASHDQVAHAVVTLAGDALAAFFIPTNGAEPELEQLKQWLAEFLPNYMIPALMTRLDAFPMTPTGKVDRNALRELSQGRIAAGDQPFTAPRNATEELLAGIWCEVLGLDRVGVHDSFFDLGGHSLLSVQVTARVRRLLGVDLPIRSLFETPTIAHLAVAVERASQFGLLEQPPISLVDRRQALPLSFSQQRLWFLNRLEPESSVYILAYAFRIAGPLNPTLFEKSLNAIVARHEALRTVFGMDEQRRPIQIVQDAIPEFFYSIDLRDLPGPEREARVLALQREEKRTTFDLTRGPLLRCGLLLLEEELSVFLLTMHHIVSDAWSLNLFMAEVARVYRSLVAAEPEFPLADLPIQYADFAAWQRQWLVGEVIDRQLAFWRQQLAGATPTLDLPTDFPRPKDLSSRGDLYSFRFSKQQTARLIQLSRELGATLFMTSLACYQVLLARRAQQKEVVIGTPVAGRDRTETEGLVGFFLNTLALRTDLAGNPSFRELLDRVRGVTLAAFQHRDLPFEVLIQNLDIDRNLGRSPVFQAMLVFKNVPDEVDEGIWSGDFSIEQLQDVGEVTKFELSLEMKLIGEELDAAFEYSTDLYTANTMGRMADELRLLADAFAADPDRPIEDVPLVTGEDRARTLVAWNRTRVDHPFEGSIQRLFEIQADGLPDSPALIGGDQVISFGELNARANRLAHYLAARGVAAETPVGVAMARGMDAIVGMLAILKAGGTYLYLDPTFPKDRLAFMLADAGVQLVLTHASMAANLPDSRAEVVCIDERAAEIDGMPETNTDTGPALDRAAYIIYTSGSSGVPKGVIGRHWATLNRLHWAWRSYPFEAGEVCCQKTSLNFVDSVSEIWGPLLQGVPLCVIPDEMMLEPKRLIAELTRHKVSRLLLVPALLRLLLDHPLTPEDLPPSLKLWITSGEPLTSELVTRFEEWAPGRVLLNLYGSSEVAGDVTYSEVSQAQAASGIAAIGRPLDNVAVYLLDKRFEPVPVGVPGEVHVGGLNQARGYLARPNLTAERFVPDPFAQVPGSRLFCTGDLARYLPDGSLLFAGRKDQQLKIRGFRIEPGEVELVLRQVPGVADAAVRAFADESGQPQLAAYLVATEGAKAPGIETVKRALAERLPAYLIPSVFTLLDAFPLTPSGKLDRRALPQVKTSRDYLEVKYIAPSTAIEKILSKFWQEALGTDRIGVLDNFFDLGGHSLLATQVVSRINEGFQTDLPIRSFFDATTIGGIADLLKARAKDPGQVEEMAEMLLEIEAMSEEAVDQMLDSDPSRGIPAQAVISKSSQYNQAINRGER